MRTPGLPASSLSRVWAGRGLILGGSPACSLGVVIPWPPRVLLLPNTKLLPPLFGVSLVTSPDRFSLVDLYLELNAFTVMSVGFGGSGHKYMCSCAAFNQRLYINFSSLCFWPFVPGVPWFQVPVSSQGPRHAVFCLDFSEVSSEGAGLPLLKLSSSQEPHPLGCLSSTSPLWPPLSVGHCTVAISALVRLQAGTSAVADLTAGGSWFGLPGPNMP